MLWKEKGNEAFYKGAKFLKIAASFYPNSFYFSNTLFKFHKFQFNSRFQD